MSSRGSWIHYWRKKMLKLWRRWLFLRKFPSYKMLEAMRVLGHVTLDPCAAPMLFPRNLQNLHLSLMEARHWAKLSIRPEWLFPHLSWMCPLLLPTFKPHASFTVHRPLSSGMRTWFPHCKLRERVTKVHWSLHNTSVAELLPFELCWLMLHGASLLYRQIYCSKLEF